MTLVTEKHCEASGCNEPFLATRSDARYCSDACRQRAYRERLAVEALVEEQPDATTNTPPVTAKPSMPIRIHAFWGDIASVVMHELLKPEEEPVSVTRSDLETLAAVLRWFTECGDFDTVMPEGFDTIAYRAEQKAICQRQLGTAIREATEAEAKQLIEELRQHIKELKREARDDDGFGKGYR